MSIYSENDEQLDRLKQTERLLKEAGIQEKVDDKGVIESIIDLEMLKSVWSAFGLYLEKQLKMGRGVVVKELGQFNFSHPEYNLIGSTNPLIRDKQERVPVFLINKEFIKGRVIRQGIYTNQGLRAYGSQGSNGVVQQVLINYTEIALYANITKEIARSSLNRIIRQIADTYRTHSNVSILIPQVGSLFIKQGIAAVSFNTYLRQVTRNIIKTDLINRITKNNTTLTPHNLSTLQIHNNNNNNHNHNHDQLSLDSGAKSYLVNTLGINLNTYNKFKNNIQQGYDINNNNNDDNNDQVSIKSNQSRSNSISYQKKQRPQTSVQRQQSQDQKSQLFTQKLMLSRLSNKAVSIRKLKEYLRMRNLDTEEGFIELVQGSLGSVVFNSKLSYEQLMKGIQMLGIELNEVQIQELFGELDINKDGFVDFSDFSQVIRLENDLLQKQRDVIQINQLETDDVLMRMGLSRDSTKMDVISLRDKLMKLNEELDQQKAMKLAQLIMGPHNQIDTEYLLVQLEVNDEESKVYNINWYRNILMRLRKQLTTDQKIQQLLNDFEKYDTKNQGLLDVANYKTVLLKAHLSLSIDEINRMVRYTQKKDDLIDYLAVIKDLQNILKTHSNQDCFLDIHDFAQQFLKFMQNSPHRTPILLIKHINNNNNKPTVPLNTFLNFLHSVFPNCSFQELTYFASSIDIDQDSQIDIEDLNNFINKHKFYTQTTNKSNKNTNIHIHLFPTKELPEEKIDIIIRDLRSILQHKKISYYDLFQRLDQNQDGFISFDEFDKNLENIMRLSQPIKEGLFSYFDRQKIGLIDYQQFLKVMKKVLFIKEIRTTEDNWKWQEEVIDKIREWYNREKINVEQAFKSIDNDFDGFIGKQDLHHFLIDVLKYEPNDINPCKLDRLFKLMDQYKRGQVQFLDFKRLLTENNLKNYINKNKSNYINDLKHSITNGFKEQMTNSFNWILNAKQQIGLVLSRKFKTIQESFDIISGYKNRLLYDKFKVWIEQNQTLNGFDLTDKLLLEVYSSLDPHKKGYLTLNDFQNNFSNYHWQNQMVQEIQQAVENNFENIDKAFQYFIQQDKGEERAISKEQFIRGINSIFTNRFNNSDLDWFWNTIKECSSEMLSYCQFIIAFDKKQTHALKHLQKPYSSSQSQFQQNFFTNKDDIYKFKQSEQKELSKTDPFKVGEYNNVQEKVRNILRQSDKTLDEVFSEYTKKNISHISNIQFRNVFKQFNLGLTIREFDQLINLSDKNTDGLIDIQHFKKQIQLNKIDQRIIQRVRSKISQIRDDIYHYFITPKNAYRIFNLEGNNKMTFLQFQNFINQLEQAAGRQQLPFNIINDLFQFIDLKKDQLIDYNEWVQVFKIVQTPPSNQKINKDQQRPSTANNAFNRLRLYQEPVTKQLPNLVSAQLQDNVKVEQSKDYDQVMKIIGRNRKYLLDLFKDMETIDKKIIDFKLVKSTIQELLRNNGFQVNDFYWPFLLKFANTRGVIDYKYLLDVYKYKNNKIDQIPQQN